MSGKIIPHRVYLSKIFFGLGLVGTVFFFGFGIWSFTKGEWGVGIFFGLFVLLGLFLMIPTSLWKIDYDEEKLRHRTGYGKVVEIYYKDIVAIKNKSVGRTTLLYTAEAKVAADWDAIGIDLFFEELAAYFKQHNMIDEKGHFINPQIPEKFKKHKKIKIIENQVYYDKIEIWIGIAITLVPIGMIVHCCLAANVTPLALFGIVIFSLVGVTSIIEGVLRAIVWQFTYNEEMICLRSCSGKKTRVYYQDITAIKVNDASGNTEIYAGPEKIVVHRSGIGFELFYDTLIARVEQYGGFDEEGNVILQSPATPNLGGNGAEHSR